MSTPFPQSLATTVAAALSLLPFAGAAQQSGLDRLVHHTTLENGLEVVVAENRAVPLATVLVAVSAALLATVKLVGGTEILGRAAR